MPHFQNLLHNSVWQWYVLIASKRAFALIFFSQIFASKWRERKMSYQFAIPQFPTFKVPLVGDGVEFSDKATETFQFLRDSNFIFLTAAFLWYPRIFGKGFAALNGIRHDFVKIWFAATLWQFFRRCFVVYCFGQNTGNNNNTTVLTTSIGFVWTGVKSIWETLSKIQQA